MHTHQNETRPLNNLPYQLQWLLFDGQVSKKTTCHVSLIHVLIIDNYFDYWFYNIIYANNTTEVSSGNTCINLITKICGTRVWNSNTKSIVSDF